jgi:hypothetical protein
MLGYPLEFGPQQCHAHSPTLRMTRHIASLRISHDLLSVYISNFVFTTLDVSLQLCSRLSFFHSFNFSKQAKISYCRRKCTGLSLLITCKVNHTVAPCNKHFLLSLIFEVSAKKERPVTYRTLRLKTCSPRAKPASERHQYFKTPIHTTDNGF